MDDDEGMLALRVLWLEDDPVLRKAFDMVAADLGAQVSVVASPEEAATRLADEPFDWIVADYRMNGRTSDGFVRACLADGRRVVVLTGDASSVDPDLPVRVFEKPITVQTLLGALSRSSAGR